MENLKTIIYIVTSIVTAGAILTAAVVAVRGLKTWQHQLKGQSEYELSRRILVTLFKYRDAVDGVDGVRDSAIVPVPPPEKSENMSQEQMYWYGIAGAYKVRWNKVYEKRAELYSDFLEAEAIWGKELKELFEPILELEGELYLRVWHHVKLKNPDESESEKEAIKEIDLKNRNILYDYDAEDSKEFKSDLLKAIEKIEEYLKPKLQRK